MSRKLFAVFLMAVLFNLGCAGLYAAPQQKQKLTHSEKVKVAIAKLGTGPETRVEVWLRKNHTRVIGYISEIKDEAFSISDPGSGVIVRVPYWEVRIVSGFNSNTNARVSVSDGLASHSWR